MFLLLAKFRLILTFKIQFQHTQRTFYEKNETNLLDFEEQKFQIARVL
jgi:hypothetical protein